MGRVAAVTRADTHRFGQTLARGGIGQAGVEAQPCRTPGSMPGRCARAIQFNGNTIAPLELTASVADFSY